MNRYEEKQEARRERLRERASKAQSESNARYDAAHRTLDAIPMGQPILVGHHSERRHRRALDRMDQNMRKASEAEDRAADLRHRAEAVGTGGISQDDPEAVKKLKAELATVRATIARVKVINGALKILDDDKRKEAVTALNLTKAEAANVAQFIRFWPGYRPGMAMPLTNLNASARRIEKRIEELQAKAADVTTERVEHGITIRDNVEENRLQLIFPEKPAQEIIDRLKRGGFRYSPRENAWQLHRSEQANYKAKSVLELVAARAFAEGKVDESKEPKMSDGSVGEKLIIDGILP